MFSLYVEFRAKPSALNPKNGFGEALRLRVEGFKGPRLYRGFGEAVGSSTCFLLFSSGVSGLRFRFEAASITL